MTFEEVYKFLYEKYEIVSFDYVDKRIKVKDSTTIITYDLFELIDYLVFNVFFASNLAFGYVVPLFYFCSI